MRLSNWKDKRTSDIWISRLDVLLVGVGLAQNIFSWFFHRGGAGDYLKFASFSFLLSLRLYIFNLLCLFFSGWFLCCGIGLLLWVEGSAHPHIEFIEIILHEAKLLFFLILFMMLPLLFLKGPFPASLGWTRQPDFLFVAVPLDLRLLNDYPLFFIQQIEKDLLQMQSLFLVVAEDQVELLAGLLDIRPESLDLLGLFCVLEDILV